VDGVVPLSVERTAGAIEVFHFLVGDTDPLPVDVATGFAVELSSSQWTVNPDVVVVSPIRTTMTRWLASSCSVQFIEMNERRLYSILFHSLVPCGRWRRPTPPRPCPRAVGGFARPGEGLRRSGAVRIEKSSRSAAPPWRR